MELFGRTIDGEQIAALVLMLGALALWGGRLRSEMRDRKWVKERQAELKAGAEKPKGPDHGGPWG